MNLTLFNIKENYLKLISEIEENQGEISSEQSQLLEINQEDLHEKVSNYNEVISCKESFNARIDEEIKELRRKKELNEKIIDRLKSNIVEAIKVFGPIDIGLHKFNLRKSVSVDVMDVSVLPDKYKTVKTIQSPDKVSICKALKNGEEICGCSLVENYHLKRS